jgi:hypothetical protein
MRIHSLVHQRAVGQWYTVSRNFPPNQQLCIRKRFLNTIVRTGVRSLGPFHRTTVAHAAPTESNNTRSFLVVDVLFSDCILFLCQLSFLLHLWSNHHHHHHNITLCCLSFSINKNGWDNQKDIDYPSYYFYHLLLHHDDDDDDDCDI